MLLVLAAAIAARTAIGADDDQPTDVKQLQGISIRGDREAPRSLYIVPWQSAEQRQNTSMPGNPTGSGMQAIDRESFRRQLHLYELGKTGWHRITAGSP
jgi:hypothetical protein